MDSKRDLSVSLNRMLVAWLAKRPAGGFVATTRARREMLDIGKVIFPVDTRDVSMLVVSSLYSSSDMVGREGRVDGWRLDSSVKIRSYRAVQVIFSVLEVLSSNITVTEINRTRLRHETNVRMCSLHCSIRSSKIKI